MKVGHLVVDCTDLDRTAGFWAALLGMKIINREADWLDLEPLSAAGPVLAFQLVPESKTVKNRLHLDLEVPDFHAATSLAAGLGGAPVSEVFGAEVPWQVWRDPEGNEFCLITEGA